MIFFVNYIRKVTLCDATSNSHTCTYIHSTFSLVAFVLSSFSWTFSESIFQGWREREREREREFVNKDEYLWCMCVCEGFHDIVCSTM